MKTPICDFVHRYVREDALRLHMPGHKGVSRFGPEPWDITEVEGADSLYEAEGIIRESEENAGRLFGTKTVYSTEGSSQCIRAMVYLAALHARSCGREPVILAGRNAHKTFLSAVALAGMDVQWLWGSGDSYLSCRLTAEEVQTALEAALPAAVYLTTPDYLGNTVDVAAIAAVCHDHGVPLLVDNAHGAYLKFLHPSRHPMDLGADLCCDSAHKTLPGLTGTAYLHISHRAPALFAEQAKNAMVLFGSTSPSYLLLASLDAVNAYLADGYPEKLTEFIRLAEATKTRLTAHGWRLTGDEPLKITLCTKAFGYTGRQAADLLLKKNIVCEFSDADYLVMMLTPEIGAAGLERLETALLSVPRKAPLLAVPPQLHRAECVMSVREAVLSPCEIVPAAKSVGRVLAAASVGCPPAVPIVVCGERIDAAAAACFAYYGIESVTVIRE